MSFTCFYQNQIKRFFFSLVVIFSMILMSSVQAKGLPDFTQLVKEQSAAVVNISTKKTKKTDLGAYGDQFNGGGNEMLEEFMRRFFDGQGQGGGSPSTPPRGSSLGSGFIISKDGYVVTNHHVINGADEIIVRLKDRRELSAKLIGSDKRSDLALLKVEGGDLPVLKVGNSEQLEVGEWVVAIGSPFGFDHSVTAGIVSAKGRSLPSENYVPFLQTDVAINPGNSGGPLFNLKGEVIGINSQIYSRTGGFMGVSFAIPIDTANRVIEQLKTNGKVSRGWLGVYIQEVTKELAQSFGIDNPKGALVAQVMKQGPANGILQRGDIVLEFNGNKIAKSAELPVFVGSAPVGKSLKMKIRRGGVTKMLDITLKELPSENKLSGATTNDKTEIAKADSPVTLLGMELEELSDAKKKLLDIEENGIFVKRVTGDPATAAGILAGDVVLNFNNQMVTSLDDIKRMSKNLVSGKSYALLVQRNGSARFLALKIK